MRGLFYYSMIINSTKLYFLSGWGILCFLFKFINMNEHEANYITTHKTSNINHYMSKPYGRNVGNFTCHIFLIGRWKGKIECLRTWYERLLLKP